MNKFEDNYIMFGTKKCSYCIKARNYFEKNNIKYGYLDVDVLGRGKVKRILKGQVREQKTLPYIFKNLVFVGGYSDLIKNNSLS